MSPSSSLSFQFADSWPVGSFRVNSEENINPVIFQHFDVPCWPELTSLGAEEELVGFWLPLFQRWEESPSDELIEKSLSARPGLVRLREEFQEGATSLLKGQMIGPVTLQWALKQKQVMVIDREKILEFIWRSFAVQATVLRRLAANVIISLDEPCAFLDWSSERVWQEFFARFYQPGNYAIALHSCGEVNTSVFKFPWQVIHLDFKELQTSLTSSSEIGEAMREYIDRGGWIALGLMSSSPLAEEESIESLAGEARDLIQDAKSRSFLLSTSCGMTEANLELTTRKLERLGELAETLVESFRVD